MKNNKVFLMALAATVATPAVVAPITIEAATTSFKDISSTHPYKAKIDALVQKGVIAGYTDGTFRPTEKVNRGQFALFISRALDLPMPSNPQSFRDVGKTSAVYEGVVKAQAAGIIQGYTDGRFRAGDLITRGDMAIMLDRALQYKGSYTNKAKLSYSDKGSIGVTAYSAVERLAYYGIVSPLSGTTKFAPQTTGDRIGTVLSIYELMDTKKLLVGTDSYPAGDIRNYSVAEIEAIIGKQEFIRRNPDKNGEIEFINVAEDMVKSFESKWDGHPALNYNPQEYYNRYYILPFNSSFAFYSEAYPKYELVTINGVPFNQTKYFEPFKNPMFITDEIIFNQIPNPPTESGKFLIDLPSMNRDLVTYHNGRVDVERMATLVKKTSNNDYLVDVKSLFKDTNLVFVSNDGLKI
ncbi:S-layer homology domain-containing protein [Sporosarcina sp. ITBMC105]